jgi:DNA-binding response OmpR family regulator
MTVTALPLRSAHAPAHRRRIPSPRPSPSSSAGPELTVRFEVTLTGNSRYTDAAEILDTLQRITERLDSAKVELSPIPAPVEAPDNAAVHVSSAARSVTVHGHPVALTRVEFDLLLYLGLHPRRVFTRGQLLQSVWGYAPMASERTVDVHIRRLRAKLDTPSFVTTVRGVGYRLADDASLAVVA